MVLTLEPRTLILRIIRRSVFYRTTSGRRIVIIWKLDVARNISRRKRWFFSIPPNNHKFWFNEVTLRARFICPLLREATVMTSPCLLRALRGLQMLISNAMALVIICSNRYLVICEHQILAQRGYAILDKNLAESACIHSCTVENQKPFIL